MSEGGAAPLARPCLPDGGDSNAAVTAGAAAALDAALELYGRGRHLAAEAALPADAAVRELGAAAVAAAADVRALAERCRQSLAGTFAQTQPPSSSPPRARRRQEPPLLTRAELAAPEDELWQVSLPGDASGASLFAAHRHEPGSRWHTFKMAGAVPASVADVMSVAREFDLISTWNRLLMDTRVLAVASMLDVTVYGAVWLPWPLGTSRPGHPPPHTCISARPRGVPRAHTQRMRACKPCHDMRPPKARGARAC